MKTILLILFLPLTANATWQGKLDLNSSIQPIVLREINDGQWLAGIAHPNLWHLDHNGNEIFHVGIFHAWNAEHGNASFGPLVGLDLTGLSKDLGIDIPATIGGLGDSLQTPSLFKPAVLVSQMLSVDMFVGYRPIHTSDVNGPFVYGLGAALKIPFGVQELRSGL